MPLLLLGKRKFQPPRLTSTFSTALTTTPTRHCSSKRRSSKESASAGSFTNVGGAQWQRDSGSQPPGRRTPEQVPSAPPAPQQHLPPIAEVGESTAGQGASEEGASSQDGGRTVGLDSESDLDMTRVGPVLPATRKAPAAEAEGNPLAPSPPSKRAEISSVNDSSNSSTSNNRTSGSGSNGDMPALTGTEARRLQYLSEPLEL